MKLIINDLSQYGLLIHGPESPAYRERFNTLIGVPSEFDEDASRYSIIIENQSPAPIIALTVIWRYFPPQGEPIPNSYTSTSFGRGVFNYVSGNVIESGEQSLWSPINGPRARQQGGARIRSEVKSVGAADRVETLLARSVKWSVSIDGALFRSGAFVGPDTNGYFEFIYGQTQGARDLIRELNDKLDAGEDAFALAEQIASVTDKQIEAPYPNFRERMRNPDHAYSKMKTEMARHIVYHRQNAGEQAAINLIRASANNWIPLVRV